jgi:hypothetical protein
VSLDLICASDNGEVYVKLFGAAEEERSNIPLILQVIVNVPEEYSVFGFVVNVVPVFVIAPTFKEFGKKLFERLFA